MAAQLEREPQPIRIPRPESFEVQCLIEHHLDEDERWAPLRSLLHGWDRDLRVVRHQGGGAIWYDLAVSHTLDRVFILDASFVLRELARADTTVRELPHLGGERLAALKRYDDLAVYRLSLPGGRHSMTHRFETKGKAKWIALLVDTIAAIPKDEGVILFTFKPRKGGPDFGAEIKRALTAKGIANDPKRARVQDHSGRMMPRFAWLTFGQETSLSEHSYCKNVIFVGLLHREALQVAGEWLGQKRDLWADLSGGVIPQIEAGERDHVFYQGLSRGFSRTCSSGKAGASKVWLIHNDKQMEQRLEKVLPGAQWHEWQAPWMADKPSAILSDPLVGRIASVLRNLPAKTEKVSIREIKLRAGAQEVPRKTWQTRLDAALRKSRWKAEGQSVIRNGAPS
ncbi:MAG: hypothetical protein JNK68_01390 [Betaproteobacteria bacterium]|nr:hypothetical protein [Betaproteobacteria bacterium]